MNQLLIVREEIVCLLILCFILLYSRLYKMGKDQGSFLRICIFAIGHVVFDIITVLTVNHIGVWPDWLNYICHIVFYAFALLFSFEFYSYTVSLCYSKKTLKKARHFGIIPIVIYMLTVYFLPMKYVPGNGTYYSFGTAAFVGYGIAMLFFLTSIIIILAHIKKLDKYLACSLLPMMISAIAAEIIQIAVPELLFTGGVVTIITVGFFFSLENPVAMLRHKAAIDAMTGVKSRNCYETEIGKLKNEFDAGAKLGFVFCDINDLKSINDTYGHPEGDSYIATVAQILMKNLKSAEAVYRYGGDEFLTVYKNTGTEIIKKEANAATADCEKQSKQHDYPMSIALGYSVSDDCKSVDEMLQIADYRMYANKTEYKLLRKRPVVSFDSINVNGLTDRLFEALARINEDRFFCISNIETNVTRYSRSAVEYFGLEGEFVSDSSGKWLKRIHPDDRDAFLNEINSVWKCKQNYYTLKYRIKNSLGDYVNCSCSVTVIGGRNGTPDLMAETMYVQSAEESIDPITRLRNSSEMCVYINHLISNHIPAALLEISILNLNRMNMLYGYERGNDLLRQFAGMINGIVQNNGCVFRDDGTKFVVCVPGSTKDEIRDIYKNIKSASEHQIHISDGSMILPLKFAAGALMLPERFSGSGTAVRNDLIFALTKSGVEKRGNLVFFDELSKEDTDDSVVSNKLLRMIFQDAVSERRGFYLEYQPIVDAKTESIIGAEALLRWKNAEFGVVSPGKFIPWLEVGPSFFELGNWILRKAMTEAMQAVQYNSDFKLNINISMPQFENEGFRNSVLEAIRETGFPAEQLCLELTERCRELDHEYLKNEIDFLRDKGISVALDDIGTGFSSLGLLLSMNVNEVKVDRMFIREIQAKQSNQVLTKLIIDASRDIGHSVCLEGIEDENLYNHLKSYGATHYQGYYFSKPLKMSDFIPFMTNWNSNRVSDKSLV